MKHTVLTAISPLKIFILICMFVYLFFLNSSPISALTVDEEVQYQHYNVYFLDDSSCPSPASSGAGSVNVTPTPNLTSFVDTYGQSAFNVGQQFGIPYEAILAQAILESGYGASQLTTQGFNFFGIKAGPNWTGPVLSFETREQNPDGSSYTVIADFRAYANAEEGFRGYGEFIRDNPRYSNALNYPGDPIRYIEEVRAAGYATSLDYVTNNVALINQITTYVADNNLFPPSSQVTPSTSPPDANGSSSSTNSCGQQPTSQPPGDPNSNRGIGRRLAEERGWGDAEFTCLDNIWSQESGWDTGADNSGSSAYGIPQALMGLHKANIDANYPGYYDREIQVTPGVPASYNYEGGSAEVQIKWGLDYIAGRYGTPCEGWEYKQSHGVY